jgi:putative holliday junction resolvase
MLDEIARHRVGGVVIGLPLALDGSDSPRTQGVRQFAKNLLAHTELPVAFWDERLSTAAVERGMIAADLSRRRRAELIDKVAAAYILQGLLDRLNHRHVTI